MGTRRHGKSPGCPANLPLAPAELWLTLRDRSALGSNALPNAAYFGTELALSTCAGLRAFAPECNGIRGTPSPADPPGGRYPRRQPSSVSIVRSPSGDFCEGLRPLFLRPRPVDAPRFVAVDSGSVAQGSRFEKLKRVISIGYRPQLQSQIPNIHYSWASLGRSAISTLNLNMLEFMLAEGSGRCTRWSKMFNYRSWRLRNSLVRPLASAAAAAL